MSLQAPPAFATSTGDFHGTAHPIATLTATTSVTPCTDFAATAIIAIATITVSDAVSLDFLSYDEPGKAVISDYLLFGAPPLAYSSLHSTRSLAFALLLSARSPHSLSLAKLVSLARLALAALASLARLRALVSLARLRALASLAWLARRDDRSQDQLFNLQAEEVLCHNSLSPRANSLDVDSMLRTQVSLWELSLMFITLEQVTSWKLCSIQLTKQTMGQLHPTQKLVFLPPVLVPFVKAIVPDIDMDKREMQITPPKGLLELNVKTDERSKKERRQLVLKDAYGVASATATFVMMFSSSLSVVEFYLLKRFPIPYALYLISISVIAGLWGQFFVRKLVTFFDRASIIVFILSAVIFASALTMGVAGAKKSFNMIEKHDYMGFLSICDRN
ncbi:hypothetical protein Syun_005100 [Stephania yunnanensis]|uniref:Uncharacterized protein n=1 Tax=Stephania yunnanensis TaxID=152371 RepID=A0AAP0Q1X1_9MAGN